MANITMLRARLSEIETERRSIHTAAGEAALEGDAATRWEVLDSEEAELRTSIATLEAEEARAATLAASRARWGSLQVGTAVPDDQAADVRSLNIGEARDRALKRLEVRGREQGGLSDAQLSKVERLLRSRHVLADGTVQMDGDAIARQLLITETDAYRSAFMKGVLQAQPAWTPEEARAIEAMRAASLTSGAGGFGVPVLIDPTIALTGQESLNPMRQLARTETITTNAWKGISSAGVSWSYDAEGVEVSDDAPTLVQPSVSVHGARGFIPYSIEISQDYPNFANEFGRLLAEGYDELQSSSFITGSGSGAPFGILTALDANTNVEVVVGTDGAFSAPDVDKVWTALPDKYKANATWLMSSDVASYISAWGDAYGGRTADLAGNLTTLRGRPHAEATYMPDFTAVTTAANILVVGDFRNYLIVDRAGMTVENVPHLFSTTTNLPNGQRGIFAFARHGADSINDLGFRLLQNQ